MGVRVISLIAVASLLIACGDSHTSVYEDQIELFEDLTELLEGVDDSDSAKDAADEIAGSFRDDMLSIQARLLDLGAPDADAMKDLMELQKELGALSMRFAQQASKFQQYPELTRAMQTLAVPRG